MTLHCTLLNIPSEKITVLLDGKEVSDFSLELKSVVFELPITVGKHALIIICNENKVRKNRIGLKRQKNIYVCKTAYSIAFTAEKDAYIELNCVQKKIPLSYSDIYSSLIYCTDKKGVKVVEENRNYNNITYNKLIKAGFKEIILIKTLPVSMYVVLVVAFSFYKLFAKLNIRYIERTVGTIIVFGFILMFVIPIKAACNYYDYKKNIFKLLKSQK